LIVTTGTATTTNQTARTYNAQYHYHRLISNHYRRILRGSDGTSMTYSDAKRIINTTSYTAYSVALKQMELITDDGYQYSYSFTTRVLRDVLDNATEAIRLATIITHNKRGE
jgi:hypothetical protein